MKRPVIFDLKMKTKLRIMGVVGAVALAATLTTSRATAAALTAMTHASKHLSQGSGLLVIKPVINNYPANRRRSVHTNKAKRWA